MPLLLHLCQFPFFGKPSRLLPRPRCRLPKMLCDFNHRNEVISYVASWSFPWPMCGKINLINLFSFCSIMVLKFLETRILKMKRKVVSFKGLTHLIAVPASTLAVFYSCRFVYTHSNAALSCRPNIYQPKLNTELLHPFNAAFLSGSPIFRSCKENWPILKTDTQQKF